MSRIFIHGTGAVSPAGWRTTDLYAAVKNGIPLPVQTLSRPGWEKSLQARTVPPPATRPAFLTHPRLRRAGAMAQHTVAAALEAIGLDAVEIQAGKLRLGVIVCMMAGGVSYSRRFYEEVLREPSTASPLIFPETVFNAPASHLSAYLNSSGINYTLVGDEGMFLQGVALAAGWLQKNLVDACVVAGTEEVDWIVADAVRLFKHGAVYSGGAGAIYMKKTPADVELAAVTEAFSFTQTQSRAQAIEGMRKQLPLPGSTEMVFESDDDDVWKQGAAKQFTPKKILGEAFLAAAAWQCVAACEAVRNKDTGAATIGIVGSNQQAIGGKFIAASAG